jgi:lipoprotein LprG
MNATPGSRPRRLALVAAGVAALAGACGGPSTPTGSGAGSVALLQRAKTTFDQTSSFHIKLTSADVSGSGIVLEGATGDAVRPNGFSGVLTVAESGLPIQIPVVSMGGTFYVQLPLTSGYQTADPSQYGFADPGKLLDPSTGVSTLLTSVQDPVAGGSMRLSGESLQEVSGTEPGAKVKALLTDANPSQPVAVTFAIDPAESDQLRQVVLTGPLVQSGQNSTYTLLLTGYGESVSVTAPPG